jgi:hypothetical protein
LQREPRPKAQALELPRHLAAKRLGDSSVHGVFDGRVPEDRQSKDVLFLECCRQFERLDLEVHEVV